MYVEVPLRITMDAENLATADRQVQGIVKQLREQGVSVDAEAAFPMGHRSGEAAAKVVTDFANGMGNAEADEFVAALGNSHRTLQQLVTGLFFRWLKHLAGLPEDRYDLRNEASVRAAQKIVSLLGDDMHLPLV